MKTFVLLIYQGTTPLPGTDRWQALPEAEQKAIYADAMTTAGQYQAIKNDAEGNALKGKVAAALGAAYAEEKKWADAEKQLTEATSLDPAQSRYFEALGFIQLNQDKLEEALASYKKALEIKPTSTSAPTRQRTIE